MTVQIRTVAPDDATLQRSLAQRCPPLDIHTPYTCWVQANYCSDTCYIAEIDGEPAGYLTAVRAGHRVLLWQIGVLPGHRGHGIAARLIDTLDDRRPVRESLRAEMEPLGARVHHGELGGTIPRAVIDEEVAAIQLPVAGEDDPLPQRRTLLAPEVLLDPLDLARRARRVAPRDRREDVRVEQRRQLRHDRPRPTPPRLGVTGRHSPPDPSRPRTPAEERPVTTAIPDRRIPVTSAANMRDLGGLPVDGGSIAPGQVYRSATLAKLSDADGQRLVELGIETVYDLRTAAERDGAPDRLPAQITAVALDVLADSPLAAAANINALLADPAQLAAALQGRQAEDLLRESYRDIVRLPSALRAYRSMYLHLADETRNGAALVHCTTGKDRTGWAAASLLTLLGADGDVVRADYLQTNQDLLPALQPMIDRATALGLDPERLVGVLGVRESYLDAAFDEVASRYGSIEDYLVKGLELDADVIDRLRTRFIR